MKQIYLVVVLAGLFLLGDALASFADMGSLFYPTGTLGDNSNISFVKEFIPQSSTQQQSLQSQQQSLQSQQQSLQSPQKQAITSDFNEIISYKGDSYAGICWLPKDSKSEDLTGVRRLTFFARCKNGNETGRAIVGGPNDSSSTFITIDRLDSNWKRYEIDLSKVNLDRISWGFCVILDKKGTIYLKDINYEL